MRLSGDQIIGGTMVKTSVPGIGVGSRRAQRPQPQAHDAISAFGGEDEPLAVRRNSEHSGLGKAARDGILEVGGRGPGRVVHHCGRSQSRPLPSPPQAAWPRRGADRGRDGPPRRHLRRGADSVAMGATNRYPFRGTVSMNFSPSGASPRAFADREDVKGEIGFLDGGVGPDGLDELFLRDEAAGIGGQHGEHVESLRRERHRLAVLEQETFVRDERDRAEPDGANG